VIKIICVGKLKEKYLKDACEEYLKRLSKYTKVELIELEDEKIDSPLAIIKEEAKILKHLKDTDYVITLEIDGKMLNSLELSSKIDKTLITNSTITFVIGSSYGLSTGIKERSNYALSFSKMTFPHQLFRIMLLEQIYRSFKILNNENYHK